MEKFQIELQDKEELLIIISALIKAQMLNGVSEEKMRSIAVNLSKQALEKIGHDEFVEIQNSLVK